MIDSIVDAEETVVDFVVELCLDGLVLGVVLLKVERELLFVFLCVDGGRDRDGGNLAGDDTLRGGQTKKGNRNCDSLIKNWRRPTFPQTSAVSSAM